MAATQALYGCLVSLEQFQRYVCKSEALVGHVQELMNLYIDDAWEKDKTVLGARLNASGTLNMIVERAQKQAIMLQFPGCVPCMAQGAKIAQTIEVFETTYCARLDASVSSIT